MLNFWNSAPQYAVPRLRYEAHLYYLAPLKASASDDDGGHAFRSCDGYYIRPRNVVFLEWIYWLYNFLGRPGSCHLQHERKRVTFAWLSLVGRLRKLIIIICQSDYTCVTRRKVGLRIVGMTRWIPQQAGLVQLGNHIYRRQHSDQSRMDKPLCPAVVPYEQVTKQLTEKDLWWADKNLSIVLHWLWERSSYTRFHRVTSEVARASRCYRADMTGWMCLLASTCRYQ